jgi:hypothetical protein
MPTVPPSLRSLALADLTPADLRWMIREGESLVELKAKIPTGDGIGPTIASFANSLGGWVILGVEDSERKLVGWKPPGRVDDLDYIRQLLTREVDPMPPFAAKQMRAGRHRVGVIRIYESTDTPHIVRGTGQVFVRHPGAKHPLPLDAHDHLIELARRGEEARRRADARLSEGLEVNRLLLEDELNNGQPSIRLIARAAPLTVTPTVRDWPITRAAADWAAAQADELCPHYLPVFRREGPWREPFGRGIAARVIQQTGSDTTNSALAAADSVGVIGARIRWGPDHGDPPSVHLDQLRTHLEQLATTLADGLGRAEAYGRSVADVYLSLPEKGRLHGGRISAPPRMHASRELTIPATEDDVAALAASWHREFQRTVGLESYEGE